MRKIRSRARILCDQMGKVNYGCIFEIVGAPLYYLEVHTKNVRGENKMYFSLGVTVIS